MKQLFYVLGVANSILLILVFILRKNHLPLIQSYGWIYLVLSVPAFYLLFFASTGQYLMQYRVFLGIFIAFLILEGLFDHILKIPFRDNWVLLTPYLVLYYAMNYGFVVMPWKESANHGIVMLVLFVLQLVANYYSH